MDNATRDSQHLEDILKLLRKHWSQSDRSVAQLIHSAVEPAVPNEIRLTSDAVLEEFLQNMVKLKTESKVKENNLPKGIFDFVKANLHRIDRKVKIYKINFNKSARDSNQLENIIRLIRKIWLQSDRSVAQIIYVAIEPSTHNEVRNFSDASLKESLQAMIYFKVKSESPNVITLEHLGALDEARNYNAASSYNWLKSELLKIREKITNGENVIIKGENGDLVLNNLNSFSDWIKNRYPGINESEL